METEAMTAGRALAESLSGLKLKYWGEAMERDLQGMGTQERELISRYLQQWISKEKSERHTQMIQNRIRSARFRRLQTVENFDFRHSATTEKIEKNYLSLLAGVTKSNLPSAVFTGHAGTGKTHLARALGYACCQKGISVLFITAA